MKRISLVLLLSLSGCMGSFAQKKIETDIAVLRRDMDQLRADTKKTSGDVELRTRLAEMGATMDQIRTDLSLIQGRMESLQDAQSKRTDEALKVRQELEIRIAQLDEQVRALQKQLAAAQTSVAVVATPTPAATAMATAQPMGTLVVPDGAVKPTPLPTDPGKTIPVKLTDQQLYQKGIEARDGKRYADARATFTELITKFPKSDFADNARYWIGETYYDEKDFASAILEFDKVVKDYKSSDKVPAALLKQGYAFLEIGEKEGGVATLQDLVRKYPKSEEAKKAKEKLAKLK